jgi:WD40 repeat protein
MYPSFLMKVLFAGFALAVFVSSGVCQEKPEIFVQTGHTRGVDFLAVSENEKYLVSSENFDLLKIWDVESGREIRTVKFKGIVNNVYFLNNESFIIFLSESAEIYDIYGEKIKIINLPKAQYGGKIFITKSRKYLYAVGPNSTKVHFFDIQDGSEIKLPEQSIEPYGDGLISFGSGLFGVFYDQYKKDGDLKNNGNTGYVVYDEDLKVRKRGILKGYVGGFGGGKKVDPNLRFLYHYINFKEKPVFTKQSLDNGETLCSVPLSSKFDVDFSVFPDGRLLLGYCSKNELLDGGRELIIDRDLSIIEFLDECLYKEKKIFLKKLNSNTSYLISNNALLIAGHNDGSIKRYDIATASEITSFGVKPVVCGGSSVTNDKLLDLRKIFFSTSKETDVTFNLWNLRDASLETFGASSTTHDVSEKVYAATGSTLWFLTNPDALYSKIPKEFFVDGYRDNSLIYEGAGVALNGILKSADTKDVLFREKSDHISAIDRVTNSEIAGLYSFSDGEWIIITPEGHFNASHNGAKYLNVRIGGKVYSIDNFYEKFYNPSYVAAVLLGQKGELAGDMRKGVALPPEVKITSPAPGAEFQSDALTVTISAKDMGGGIDEIRLYQNEKMISEDQRGMKNVGTKGENITKSYQVTLLSGLNTFQAVAFNHERTQSNPDEIKVELKAAQAASDLYLFTIGINEYKNAKYNLNYGKSDALAFLNAVVGKSRAIFKQAHQYQLYDAEATRPAIESTFRTIAAAAKPQDTFVFYYAGHGVMSEGSAVTPADFYLIPTDVTSLYGDDAMLAAKAISATQLKTFCTTIKAQKQLVVLDACQSGGALKSFATRGLSEERAIIQLARSAGTVLLASTGTEQFATEFATLAHGVFTYALLQGLNGDAGNPTDGKITVKELEAYLNDEVPELTKKYRGTAQYPNSYSQGQDFPLGVK